MNEEIRASAEAGHDAEKPASQGGASVTGPIEAPKRRPAAESNEGSADVIRVRGARVHNLQSVDVDIPRDRFTVITGPSGSGKSSLAIDTLFAEGQRQYIESLSVYARQFFNQLERPDVDLVDGLPPTICIDQRRRPPSARSTVATVTELYDHLRLLYARAGEVTCYQCGAAINQRSPEQIRASLLRLPEGTKLMLLSPMVRGRRGAHADVIADIRKAGFVRARIDGEVVEIDSAPELSPRKTHTIEAVIDRIIIREDLGPRFGESIDLALRNGDGRLIACYLENGKSGGGRSNGKWRDVLYSTTAACPNCEISYEEIEPRTFSFNSPYGACGQCEGLGRRLQFDPAAVLPDESRSIEDGAIAPWKTGGKKTQEKRHAALEPFFAAADAAPDTPLTEYSPADREKLLHGGGDFPGLLELLEKEYATTTSRKRIDLLESFRGEVPCPACDGARLRPEALAVYVGGKNLAELTALDVAAAAELFAGLEFPEPQRPIADPVVAEIRKRLDFLSRVGLEYLTLDRSADSLSGGEAQRVRLATGIGSGLVGTLYILDEPSVGLHPRDNDRLISALRDLQRLGNTVLVVEHDDSMMRAGDWLIDMGPGAGERGGRIVAAGPPDEVAANEASLTGRYLSGDQRIEPPEERRRLAKSRSLTLEGATLHNLQDVDVRIPLGALVCVTGVSGSGKSSLVLETLYPALLRRLGQPATRCGPFRSLRGASQVDKVIAVDQSPIGRTPRSNPATYSGAFDEIRKLMAATRQAKTRGYTAGRFSFNTRGGRCEACQGQGQQKIEMNFLPDLFVTCPSCRGARFDRQTLQVRYRGHNIADVLDLSIDEAAEFFENVSAVHRTLEALRDVGLGYLRLGQASNTLSGGEAQRIKLATELSRPAAESTLYLLDEPTTGLHADDVRRLLDVLSQLVDKGGTVLVIEHHTGVMQYADWLIDLGPGGGQAGGRIVAEGPPEQVAQAKESATGQFLRLPQRDRGAPS